MKPMTVTRNRPSPARKPPRTGTGPMTAVTRCARQGVGMLLPLADPWAGGREGKGSHETDALPGLPRTSRALPKGGGSVSSASAAASMREAYFALLIKLAEKQEQFDAELLDRLERLIAQAEPLADQLGAARGAPDAFQSGTRTGVADGPGSLGRRLDGPMKPAEGLADHPQAAAADSSPSSTAPAHPVRSSRVEAEPMARRLRDARMKGRSVSDLAHAAAKIRGEFYDKKHTNLVANVLNGAKTLARADAAVLAEVLHLEPDDIWPDWAEVAP